MEEEKKVYLGNLSFTLTADEIKKVIEDKGLSVKEVRIITDKFSGRSKGFGFAEFESQETALQAIETLNGIEVNGRTLRVSKAKKMAPRKDNYKQ